MNDYDIDEDELLHQGISTNIPRTNHQLSI